MSFLKTFLLCAVVATSPIAVHAQQTEAPAAGESAEQEGLSILFDSGIASIRADQETVLDQAARLFRDGNPIVMIVSGNADTVGDAAANLDLSIRRARSVAQGLVARGIPIDRLQVHGRGNSELPSPTGNGVPNEENRSVSITWR